MNLKMGAVPRGRLLLEPVADQGGTLPAPALGMTSWGRVLRVEAADHGANREETSAQQLPTLQTGCVLDMEAYFIMERRGRLGLLHLQP